MKASGIVAGVRSMTMPTSRAAGIAPGFATDTFTHGAPNSRITIGRRRRERFDHLILRRADELHEPFRELLVIQGAGMPSLAAATRASVPISRSMLTTCLIRRSHSQKPMIVSIRSSRRKILSTSVLSSWRRLSSSSGQRGRATIRGSSAPAAPPAPPRVRDHGAVVRAQRRLRIVHARADSPAESARLARSARFAPTPPATTSRVRPVASSACRHFPVNVSTTAA